MTTLNGAAAAIRWPNTGEELVPPAGQVIVISGFGGAALTTAGEGVGVVATTARRGCAPCVVGAAVDVAAARSSAAGVVPVEWSLKLPMIPSARTPAPMPRPALVRRVSGRCAAMTFLLGRAPWPGPCGSVRGLPGLAQVPTRSRFTTGAPESGEARGSSGVAGRPRCDADGVAPKSESQSVRCGTVRPFSARAFVG